VGAGGGVEVNDSEDWGILGRDFVDELARLTGFHHQRISTPSNTCLFLS